jgi:succinate-semialdehyde dehydrogenase/glutarate-semialdehyde dehydrogenase
MTSSGMNTERSDAMPKAPGGMDRARPSAHERVPHDLLVGGVWQPAADGARMDVVNPATETVIAEVSDAGVADARGALDACAQAQPLWAAGPSRARSEILYHASRLLLDRSDLLAELITLEAGKPLAEAHIEVSYAADLLRWFAEEAVRIGGGFAYRPDGAARNVQLKQPVGPCLLIVPWNFPLALGARKLGPAIAAGCTSILKPAPQTPLSSLALAQVMSDAGLPPGVLNVLPSSQAAAITPPMLESGVVQKLSFTGSTSVGKLLYGQAARRVLRVSMELGGDAAFLVLDDADLDLAVDAALVAKMRNMGEACTAANRFLVHASRAEHFAERLAERMGALRLGNGLEPGVDVGPLIDGAARDKVLGLMDDARARGAVTVVGGDAVAGPGYFVAPTVLTNVPHDAAMSRTEIFGPVAAIQTFTDLDDAIERANCTSWGLVAYVITSNVDRAFNVSERLEVGMVGVNTGLVSTASAPFGGIKESGLGREGGRLGIEEYLETKYISIPVRRDVPAPQAV